MGCHHVLTRSVRDSAALLDLTAGSMPGDPYEIAGPSRPWVDDVGADPGTLRIAMVLKAPGGAVAHPECVAAVESAAAVLHELGHEVVEADPPWSVEVLVAVMSALMGTPMAVQIDARLAELGRDLADDDLEPFRGSCTARRQPPPVRRWWRHWSPWRSWLVRWATSSPATTWC